MQDEGKNKKIVEKREAYRHRAFILMLEMAFVIAIPAFIAAIVGRKLDASGGGGKYTLVFLVLAFVLSWMIIIRKYIRFNNQIKKVDSQIKQLKEEQELKNNNTQ